MRYIARSAIQFQMESIRNHRFLRHVLTMHEYVWCIQIRFANLPGVICSTKCTCACIEHTFFRNKFVHLTACFPSSTKHLQKWDKNEDIAPTIPACHAATAGEMQKKKKEYLYAEHQVNGKWSRQQKINRKAYNIVAIANFILCYRISWLHTHTPLRSYSIYYTRL